jgi:probable lipoprotein NlpC
MNETPIRTVYAIRSIDLKDARLRIHLRIALGALLLLLLVGCATYQPVQIPLADHRVDLSNTRRVKEILYSELKEWDSVEFKIGGLTKEGVDCSGLVYIIFRSRFGIPIPRSTYGQVTKGREVTQDQLRPGDLVFFRTSTYTNHVGIYLENRKFLNVSTRWGVKISSLDNGYWAGKYWKSIRLSSRRTAGNKPKKDSSPQIAATENAEAAH